MVISRTESSLLLIGATLIVFSLYQLFLSKTDSLDSNFLKIGELHSLQSNAKSRFPNDLVWKDMRQGDGVVSGTSVFTGEKSQATINLNSGDSLELSSNTLVRISDVILLEDGLISTTIGQSPLEIEIKGERVKIEGAGAQLQLIQTTESTSVSVLDGQVNLSKASGAEALSKNEELVFLEKSRLKNVNSIELISPENNSSFWARENHLTLFSWKNSISDNLKLEVAKDIHFKKILITKEISGNEDIINLSSGHYYWRVKGENSKSVIRHFTIQQEAAIELIYPRNEELIKSKMNQLEMPIQFSWKDTFIKDYQIDVFWNEEKVSKITNENQIIFNLPVGKKYKWKITPIDDVRKNALASEVSSFEIQMTKPLVVPQWNYENLYIKLSKSQESQEIDVSWQAESFVYEWELSNSQNIILKQSTNSHGISFPAHLDSGLYFLKVRSVDEEGNKSAWSEDLRVEWLRFQDTTPEEGQMIELDRPDQKVIFKWNDSGEQYFELSTNQEFNDIIISRKAKGATEIVFPEVGTYFWRVRKTDGSFSRPVKVQVEPSPPLKAPEAPPVIKKQLYIRYLKKSFNIWDIIFPRAHASEETGNLIITLPENKKADGYKIEIFTSEELGSKVYEAQSTTNEISWPQARIGVFWYRYSFIDAWGRSSEMSPASQLIITEGQLDPPERARLIRPIRAVVLEESKEVNFSWTESKRAKKYELMIANDNQFTDIVFQKELETNSHWVNTEKFQVGIMSFWKVNAIDKRRVTESNIGRFVFGKKPATKKESNKSKIKKNKSLRPTDSYSYLALNFKPATLESVINDDEFNGLIEGSALNSFYIQSKYVITKKWMIDFHVERQSGTVFKDESFERQSLTLAAQYQIRFSTSISSLGLGINRSSLSNYKLVTPQTVSSEEVSGVLVHANLEHEWRISDSNSLHGKLNLGFGDLTHLGLDVYGRRFIRSDFFVQAGLQYETLTTDKNEMKSIGILVGAGASF
jgi:hypothetical protein